MLSNTATRYGAVTKFFHWTIAIGIMTMIPLGIIATDMPYDTAEQLAQKAQLFSIHKTVGVVIFFVALARIIWALTQPKPAPLHPERKIEVFVAEVVHWLLYGSLVIVPLSGWIHHAATSGYAPIWGIGQNLPFVPENERLSQIAGALHGVFEKVLMVSLILHIVGAAKHHILDKDDTLRRMTPGVVEAGTPAPHPVVAPLIGALAAWAVAIGIGAGMGVFTVQAAPAQAELAEVESDWQKQDGEIALSIRQFGNEVTGSFADFTAQIRFDETPGPGPKGDVRVEVAIPSLTLGSVTQQAMGPDFFNAEAHPTAIFEADILRAADGYEAQGTLTIKDQSVPLTLPFQLHIDGDTAQMEGRVTLDRRDFAIGSNMTDEGQLGFEVALMVKLTATRAE